MKNEFLCNYCFPETIVPIFYMADGVISSRGPSIAHYAFYIDLNKIERLIISP